MLLLGLSLAVGPAGAATFVVDSTNDDGDQNSVDGVCDTGPPTSVCTLRAAIEQANALAGADVIEFNIAPGGPQTISPGSALPTITSVVTIDGTTQPGWVAAPIIEINGAGSGGANGFTLSGGSAGSTIQGLVIGQFNQGIRLLVGTSANIIIGNYIGTDKAGTAPNANSVGVFIQDSPNNRIGGPAAADRNVIAANAPDGIQITGASATGNVIQGNYIGIDVGGATALGNAAQGVAIFGGASSNTVGGTGAGEGNVISGNGNIGVGFGQAGTTGNVVEGNLIGTDATGTARVPNLYGVGLQATSSGNIIGDAAGSGNVISGNNRTGILIDNSSGNTIQNNRIGTDVSGTSDITNVEHGIHILNGSNNNQIGGVGLGNVISGNTVRGIDIGGSSGNTLEGNIIGRDATDSASIPNLAGGVRIDSSNNTIGGTGPGVGNTIGGNSGGDGVAITGGATGIAVLQNSIFSNAGLGIDLGNDGVTTNDVGDGDAGENNWQNFPVLSAAATDGATNVHIAGSLNGAASTTFRVEFFAGSAPDPTGFGEGRRYLGFANVATDGTGNAVIGVTLSTAVAAGEFVTATATDPGNNTSEFAANVTAVGDLVVTTTADTVDGDTTSVTALIANNGADGRISLREAIEATNATAGADTIRFGIPLADAGHFYYQDDAIASSLSTITATTLADADILDFDPDYPPGFTRSWYRIQPNPVLPDITDSVVVDAQTQPGFIVGAPVIELDGSGGGGAAGLSLRTGPGTVRGFVLHSFTNNGLALRGAVSGYTITGNYIGTDVSGTVATGTGVSGIFVGEIGGAATTIGGDTPAERNIISGNGSRGVFLWDGLSGITSQIRIQGNYIGTDVTGTVGLGVQGRGVTVEFTGGHLIGGGNPGEGNVVSGNAGFAIELNGNQQGGAVGAADNNVIEGNLIGTDASGTAPLPNAGDGVIMFGTTDGTSSASNNTVRGNVIVGATGALHGIRASGTAVGNLFENNFIGTDSGGTIDLGNTGHGIFIRDSNGFFPSGNTIRNNVIRFNDLDGVRVIGASTTATTVTQNAIWSNDGLGIDLNGDGVTGNDPGDADSGPNDLLNWPFIFRVSESGGTLTVEYTLDVPAGDYRVEFFKNPSGADPSGNGEGEVFVSSQNINHTGSGIEGFSHSFPGAVGDTITATATLCTDGTCTAFTSTSEFGNEFTLGVTAVELTSFSAVALDRAVDLSWQTASELNNLGFHLYRASSETGPFERITANVIPGLGSSPTGAEYSYRDVGLTNDVTYFYKLEDVETTGRTELHGPVSATPRAEASETENEEPEDSRITVGDPSAISLNVVERSRSHVVLELETGGFYAKPQEDGSVRLSIPGFEGLTETGSPEIPVKRSWVEAIAGRRVRLASVMAHEVEVFTGLRPSDAETPEIVVGRNGTVRAGRGRSRVGGRRVRGKARADGLYPTEPARVVSVGFQRDVKKALVELAPLRWDGATGRLLLARRLVVRLSFRGREPGEETTDGVRGRRRRAVRHRTASVPIRLATKDRGLYAVSFEDLFGRRRDALRASELRLSRLGELVAHHLEPASDRFGPGSTLYFVSDGAAANPYGREAVYELELGLGGQTMKEADASPAGEVVPYYWHTVRRERNRYYQAGLEEAPDLWLWETILAPATKAFSFSVEALASTTEPSRMTVWLQGASDLPASPDHHVRVHVNGTLVEELLWDGKRARRLDVELPPGVVLAGDNTLEIENVGDTEAAYSMVMLDRFELVHPRLPAAVEGKLEGSWSESGVAELSGLSEGTLLLDTTRANPRWLDSVQVGDDGIARARVEAGRRYLAVGPGAVQRPEIREVSSTGLASEDNRADYLVITPEAFFPAVAPLLELRRDQGLHVKVVSIEDVYSEFGFGEERPQALEEFLSHAYHAWRSPAPRYVVLLGDATYDFKDYLGTGVRNQVPPLMLETSYLWTASDPSYAAVNGEDILPDLAIGRLPAATLEEAQSMVEKIVAYETGDVGLERAPLVLVADDPDRAGDFVANADAIASGTLAGHDVRKIYLSELGVTASRAAIPQAFDEGASLLSYMGHGGIHLWASEKLFDLSGARSLSPQPQQPIVLTVNCLNGYFHFPYFNSLAEELLKSKDKGAVAAFSPSGLSLNSPAHRYHRALLEELFHGAHERLGDAVMAAQEAYARSGAFPELLSIYHLLGDPALRLR